MHLANVINSLITTFWGLFMTYQRPFVDTLFKRFSAEKPLIQVLVGPRQVGKTTGVRQLLELGTWPHH